MRIGAIDIGSNSTRLLVADVEDGQVTELTRDSIVTRLADGVDGSGVLSETAIARVHEAIDEYTGEITLLGCDRVGGVATSAVRDATNGAEFAAGVTAKFGVPIDVIGGDREAQLTFVGAGTGDALPGDGRALVVDIGGGSTEFIIGEDGELRFHVSTQLGAVRQSERHLQHDPPTAEELDAVVREAAQTIARNVPLNLRVGIAHGIGVAGTPTVLAAVDQALEEFDPWKVHGHPITIDACRRMLEQLGSLPLAERREVTGLHPDRAPTIVAGAAILLATMQTFGLEEVVVSEHDILYGIALSLAAD
jgi:exopolyphosphatase/guanosine-5'-triphosphate,3'-diphosphate pyrophosphatase